MKPKEPFLAAFLSVIFAGFGQLYVRRIKRGAIFVIIQACGMGFGNYFIDYVTNPELKISFLVFIPVILFILFEWFAVYDAYSITRKMNIQSGLSPKTTVLQKSLIIFGIILFILVINVPVRILIAKNVRSNIVQAFKIPTQTMVPTLLPGDRIFVDKKVYLSELPKRGDLVVFKSTQQSQTAFIKRLVGLPGEVLEIKNGKIVVNGQILMAPEAIADKFYYNRGAYGKAETIVRIPEGSYYVLGDNSVSSQDSRYWGFLPKANIIGKAYKIYFPFKRSGPVK